METINIEAEYEVSVSLKIPPAEGEKYGSTKELYTQVLTGVDLWKVIKAVNGKESL